MFKAFKDAVKAKFAEITEEPKNVFRVAVDKDAMWQTYMNSFPEGTNELFRERREYDCTACNQFIRAVGNIVAVNDDLELVSVWDVDVPEPYTNVAKALAAQMKAAPIADVFLHDCKSAGVDVNRAEINGEIVSFHHFHATIPKQLVNTNGIASVLGKKRSARDVFKRALEELTEHACETVIELADQNSLYKGQEFSPMVEKFLGLKRIYAELPEDKKDLWVWHAVNRLPESATHIRNSAIGTLLQNLSEDMELDDAVRKYEAVVAPTNYKRPTALVTKAMIQRAEKAVEELGYMDALARRYAVPEDITINNVLFADRSTRPKMKNAFEQLADEAGDARVSAKHLEKVEEVPIDKFIENILPKAETIEVLVENKHEPNFMTLIAPVNPEAKCMLKWPNNFSWSYAGEVTDSIKQRVKEAGGDVSGDLRCSLAWHNGDDLDLHLIQPNTRRIYFRNKSDALTGGALDVDMNAGGPKNDVDPVENITFPRKARMNEGQYTLLVNQYSKRSTENIGFTVEVEFDGKVYTFEYDKQMRSGDDVEVAVFEYTHENGLKMIRSLSEANASREIWGIHTQNYVKCRMVLNSPNHWDDNRTGNKHVFFILENCLKEGTSRGFYNEFLTDELLEHRKVFEMLGSRMKAEESDNQLSGLGFSTTQRNHVFLKVSGAFNRTIKVTF